MLLTLILIVTALAACVALPPLHPAQIWVFVWALAVGVYSLKLLPYLALGARAQVLIGGASLGFMSSSLIGERLTRSSASRFKLPRKAVSEVDIQVAASLTLGLTLLGLLAFLLQAAQRYGLRAALVSSSDVRHAIEAGTFKVTIKYVYAAVSASVLCGACAAMGPHRVRWAIAAGSAVLSTYFTTGRATLVIATVSALCAYALSCPRLPSRRSLVVSVLIVAIIALGSFTIGGSLIGKTFKNSELATIDSQFERHPSLRWAALPYEYISAPIAAFAVEVSLSDALPRTDGCASAGYICSILHHAGVNVNAFPEVRPFTAPPLAWNTYTSLDAPLLDGGVWLVIPAAALAGIVLGAMWEGARQRRVLAIVVYAALAPAIVTATGSNDFTAPLLLGAIVIALGAVLTAKIINQKTIRLRRCGDEAS
jgi:ABC-type glycerol-3-phosphate transport system permease component